LILLILYTALFLTTYWVSLQPRAAVFLLRLLVLLTVWQSFLVFYEWRGGSGLVNSWPIWSWMGLATDVVQRGEDYRISGLFRPKATAPHPIVMSCLLAIGILVAVVLLIREDSVRRRVLLGLSLLPMTIAMMLVDARSGYVVLGIGTIAVLVLQARNLPRFMPLGLAAMMAMGVAAVMFPSAARSTLNLFWNAGNDGSVLVRVDRLNSLPELIAQNPILGPGWLTNDPRVLLFDNTYSLGLIELGIVGLTLFVLFIVTAVARMVRARRFAVDAELTLILVGVVGGTSILSAGATFDALAFDQFFPTSILLLAVGLAGADRALRRAKASASIQTD
jgi:O-antigen ligase